MAVNLVKATDSAAASFAVYQSGSTSVTSVTVPATPNPIGTYVSFDVYIYNAVNIWGWSISTVSWNPAVMNLTKVTEGPWLENNVASVSTDFVGNSPKLFNNVAGVLSGGMSEACTSDTVAATSAGVVATLKFLIVGYGTSPVTIGGGEVADNSEDAAANLYNPTTSMSSASVTVLAPPLSISLYQSGSTSLNSLTISSTTNPIGSTFSVDAYIQGVLGSVNMWGWNLGVSWNPSILNITSVTEGSFLNQTGNTDFLAGYKNNVKGTIQGGVSDAYTSYISTIKPAGVLMTMTFKIVGFGSSQIQLSAGTPSTLLNSSYPHGAILNPGKQPVTLNAFSYSWTAATAVSPQAIITVLGSPSNGNTYPNYPITLSGINSVPGTNTEPPGQICPVTSYAWSIKLVNGLVLTNSSSTFLLNSTDVGANTGYINATLTVTAPSPTDTPAPSYIDTGTTSLIIQVVSPTTLIDVWTQNGGQGQMENASAFGPQQLVDLYAYVTYNGAPVVDKTVTFDVYLDGTYLTYVTASTDQSGLATTSYRLPWQDNNPTQYFGEMTVNASVEIAQVTVFDSCSFYYGYTLDLNKVVVDNGPSFNRYGMGETNGNTVVATVTVTSTSWFPQTFWLAATIYDNNSVPVAQYLMQETALPAPSGDWTSTKTQTFNITLVIPTWAYVGEATLYVNVFNANPQLNGVAYSPQQQTSLQINAGYPVSVTTPVSTPVQVLNVQYNVQNDEDSGIYGYWALDNYVETVQVWQISSTMYTAVVVDKGTWTTFAGALSPENGVPESKTATGTLYGEYISTFTATSFNANPKLPATFAPNPALASTTLTNWGIIGTFNYGGSQSDILKLTYNKQSADAHPFDVYATYFPGISFDGTVAPGIIYWGWTYTYGAGTAPNSVWNNNGWLNTGDIQV